MVRTLTLQDPGEIYRRTDEKIYFAPVRFCGGLTSLRRSENGNSNFVDL